MKTVPFLSIVADYREHKLKEELAMDWGSLVFYRSPAFVVVWAMVPLGVTPNQLTLAGLVLIPLIPLAAWFLTPEHAMAAVTLLALAFNVLDCADGSLARATGRSSLSGRYMDFSSDILYRNTAYASYGLIADRIWPGAVFPWLAVGLCCGLLATYARVNRLYAEKLFPKAAAGSPAGTGRSGIFDMVFSFLSGLDTLMPLLAILAWWAGALWAVLLWFLFFTLGDAAVEVISNYAKARGIDSGSAGHGQPRS